jgi:cytochrome c556
LGAAVLATATVTAFAGGHGGGLPAEVKARQAHMALYSFNIGTLAGMAKGEIDYDADAASAAAGNLAAVAALNQAAYWTPGTDSESLEGSRALPAIWENIPDAVAKGEAFAAAAATLADTAGNGLEALQAGLGAVGNGCSDCHKAYRKPNN